MSKSFILAAPSSASGKTMISLGLLRHLRDQGIRVGSAKSGPDYIDPKFHQIASGRSCINLDSWAMRPHLLRALASGNDLDFMLIEGAMGLFDGAPVNEWPAKGSSAALAAALDLPIVLIVDVSAQAQSIAALVEGFVRACLRGGSKLRIAGLILNKVGSDRHARILRDALTESRLPIFGCIPNDQYISVPSRHLGLVQAQELPLLAQLIDAAAELVEKHIDLDKLLAAAVSLPAKSASCKKMPASELVPPPGQRIAIAKDIAFSFIYSHLLAGWLDAGAELCFFSPLADEAPNENCDAVILPGGYPELHAGQISSARRFLKGMEMAWRRGAIIYGECGGYMTLGEFIEDAQRVAHPMLGLLPLSSSFATPDRVLGYRRLRAAKDVPWLGGKEHYGHEFRFSSTVSKGNAPSLFVAHDAEGKSLTDFGLRKGMVMGSFAHLISSHGES